MRSVIYLVKKKKYLQNEENLQKIDANTLGYSYSRYHLVSKEKHGLLPTFMQVLRKYLIVLHNENKHLILISLISNA